MQIVLIFKKYTQCIQSKQKERVNTQKLAIAPYEQPSQFTKSNDINPSLVYNPTQSQKLYKKEFLIAWSKLLQFSNTILFSSLQMD